MNKFLSACIDERCTDVFRAATEDFALSAEELIYFKKVEEHLNRYKALPSVERAKQMFPYAPVQPGETARELREALIMEKLKSHVGGMFAAINAVFPKGKLPGRPDELRAALRICLDQVDKIARPMGVYTIQDAAHAVNENIDKVNRGQVISIPLGRWNTLTEISGGLMPTDVFTLVGPPKVGKSQLFTDMMLAIWLAGHQVHYVSAELSFAQISRRLMGIITGISHSSLRHATVSRWAREQLQELVDRGFKGMPGFTIQATDSDGFGRSMAEVEAEVARNGAKVIGLDAVYLLEPTSNKKETWANLYELSNQVKRLAITNNATVCEVRQFTGEGAAAGDIGVPEKEEKPQEDKKKGKDRGYGKSFQLAGGQRSIQNTSMLMSVEYGKPGRERSTRVLRLLANREEDIGAVEVNYKIGNGGTDHSEIASDVTAQAGEEIPFE